jgi:hypothetical protein
MEFTTLGSWQTAGGCPDNKLTGRSNDYLQAIWLGAEMATQLYDVKPRGYHVLEHSTS